jgi:hypothetical protein
MKKVKIQNKPVIYQAKNGAIELRGDISRETIWATQADIATLFNIQRPAITKHLKNIFTSKELDENSVCSILEHTASDGKSYKTQYYNLDAILSVGYRVNSITATEFRKWATKTLREHITKGYTINRKQIQKNYQEFLKTVESIQSLLPDHVAIDPKSILELIKEFSGTWLSLDSYDKDNLQIIGRTKKSIKLTGQELTGAIQDLKKELIKKDEATDIFAQERVSGSIEGIVGNVMQSFGGADVYQSIEEKSANLLYFMVKNHPFVDGNKRSGAFAFIWFLRKSKAKGFKNINSGTLTALTLLVAESKPEKKDQMIALITQILK